MLSQETLLDLATKEHTAEFKRAVEKCKSANSNKDASYCFAAITSAFKKAKKPIFLSAPDFSLDVSTTYDFVALAKKTVEYINALPDSSFAYIELSKDEEGKQIKKRYLPYKDESGKIDKVHLEISLSQLNETRIPATEKAAALRKLRVAARSAGIKVTTELAEFLFEGFGEDELEYSDSYAPAFTDEVLSQLENITVELSGTSMKWKSLGHALQVKGELIRAGVYEGARGKKTRWTDAVLSEWHPTLLGKPTRLFHKVEGFRKDLPVKHAGETVGFITHLAEYFGRVFYKALVFPEKAQQLIREKKLKESLEAQVALSAPDASGVHNVNAWLGLGLAFTDNPAVKGTEDTETDPVALARNKNMTDPDEGTPEGDPKPDPPTDESQTISLSASDLQNLIKTAVGEATVELSNQVKEVTDKLTSIEEATKELTDVRDEVRLAEITAMEEDIKSNDEDFDPKQLYKEDVVLSEKKERLEIYIRGMNRAAQIVGAQKPVVTLSEPPTEEADLDKLSMEMFGQPYKAMLAAPVEGVEE